MIQKRRLTTRQEYFKMREQTISLSYWGDGSTEGVWLHWKAVIFGIIFSNNLYKFAYCIISLSLDVVQETKTEQKEILKPESEQT